VTGIIAVIIRMLCALGVYPRRLYQKVVSSNAVFNDKQTTKKQKLQATTATVNTATEQQQRKTNRGFNLKRIFFRHRFSLCFFIN